MIFPMIGFFDSGFGGLSILKEAAKQMPGYSYIYLGDNARAPYGSKSPGLIYKFTLEGVKKLFEKGAELVILGCNTSSGVALKKIQQEFLPAYFPDKRVLGITIPTVEEIKNMKIGALGILATEATVNSMTYPKEIKKLIPDLQVVQQACPVLVPIIEAGENRNKELDFRIKNYIGNLLAKEQNIDTIVLGCTHYALIKDKIRAFLPQNIKLVSQEKIIIEKLRNYLNRHPEMDKKLSKEGKRIFLTTENSDKVQRLASKFFGEEINLELINLY